jgi:hypothetical protein
MPLSTSSNLYVEHTNRQHTFILTISLSYHAYHQPNRCVNPKLAALVDNNMVKPPGQYHVNPMIHPLDVEMLRRADPGASPDPGERRARHGDILRRHVVASCCKPQLPVVPAKTPNMHRIAIYPITSFQTSALLSPSACSLAALTSSL